jgi:hypothetical protein
LRVFCLTHILNESGDKANVDDLLDGCVLFNGNKFSNSNKSIVAPNDIFAIYVGDEIAELVHSEICLDKIFNLIFVVLVDDKYFPARCSVSDCDIGRVIVCDSFLLKLFLSEVLPNLHDVLLSLLLVVLLVVAIALSKHYLIHSLTQSIIINQI